MHMVVPDDRIGNGISRVVEDTPTTYLKAYKHGVVLLEQAGVANAANEAMWLMEARLGISRLEVYTDQVTPLTVEAWQDTLRWFCRRAAHEPLQYILGSQEFRGLSLSVAEGVFIPRPETELLVDEVVHHLGSTQDGYIADIGTGSGCLAVAMAREIPGARVFAIDHSDAALTMAKHNARNHGVSEQIQFLKGSVVEPLYSQGLEGQFSCIVSNPPYIPSEHIASLATTVRDFEPLLALDGGNDGLDFYAQLLRETPRLLKAGGWLVLEMGQGQAAWVCDEARKQGHFIPCRVGKDAAGIDRVVCLERTL